MGAVVVETEIIYCLIFLKYTAYQARYKKYLQKISIQNTYTACGIYIPLKSQIEVLIHVCVITNPAVERKHKQR